MLYLELFWTASHRRYDTYLGTHLGPEEPSHLFHALKYTAFLVALYLQFEKLNSW